MAAADRVEAYYDALRAGEPLGPFFADDPDAVKVGISERLVGGDAIRRGLREQTETTTDWTVESRDLRVTERERHAWFADAVTLGWTDTERHIRYEFDTRWTGTLERCGPDSDPELDGGARPGNARSSSGSADADWRFVGMHVSTAGDL